MTAALVICGVFVVMVVLGKRKLPTVPKSQPNGQGTGQHKLASDAGTGLPGVGRVLAIEPGSTRDRKWISGYGWCDFPDLHLTVALFPADGSAPFTTQCTIQSFHDLGSLGKPFSGVMPGDELPLRYHIALDRAFVLRTGSDPLRPRQVHTFEPPVPLLDALERLAGLRQAGFVDDTEFSLLKAHLLNTAGAR